MASSKRPSTTSRPVTFLKDREGIERTAFATDNAAAGVAELKARGLEGAGPLLFGRPVDLPNKGRSEAKFNIFTWPLNQAPAGLRIFACQHLTRDKVWIPELQKHTNGAQRLVRVEIVARAPKDAAAQLSRMNRPARSSWLATVFASPPAAALRYSSSTTPLPSPSAIPIPCATARSKTARSQIVIASDDLVNVRMLPGAVAHGGAVSLPAASATGVIISFVKQ